MTAQLDHTYVVILAGGGGTRLWPKSRKQTPKQFLKLMGKETMMQMTASRVTKLVSWDRIIIVTNQLYKDDVAEQLPQVPTENILCEPDKRDTALAMLTGSLYAKSLDPEAVVVNAASDHVVTDEGEFLRVMKAAVKVAAGKKDIVTVGITPTYPSSGFGYIKIGDEIKKVERGLSLFKVDSFTEKPNKATAQAFISTGKYFWNANMYVWAVDTIVEAFSQHMPSLLEAAKPLLSAQGQAFHDALEPTYAEAEAISIDYAVSEKADNLVLLPGDFGWDDVGDWKVVYDLGTKNLAGNVVIGEGDEVHTLAVNAHNNLIHADKRLVALAGVDNMIVIDTPEILMIVPKDQSQDVKKLVERLKEEKQTEYL